EWKEANLFSETFVYVTVSTGISSSIIQRGNFLRGAGFAGEIGLIPVYAPGSERGIGRLENAASGPAIEKCARQLYQDSSITAKDVFTAYYNGDTIAKQVVDEAAASLAHALYIVSSVI